MSSCPQGLCLTAQTFLHLGSEKLAWRTLQQALRIAADRPEANGGNYARASTLRSVADYQSFCGSWEDAADTLQLVVAVVERAHEDAYTIACANADVAAAQLRAGLLAQAERRLREALPALRKRKGGDSRAAEAAGMLSVSVTPRKRLRGRTHPDNAEGGI